MKKTLEDRVQAIEYRNQRVEYDKAWESSWARKLSIMLLTYLVVAAYLHFVVRIDPWVNALVPVIGFLLSTLTVTFIKGKWIEQFRKK